MTAVYCFLVARAMKLSTEMQQQQLLWLVTVVFVTLSFLVPGVPSWKSHPRELARKLLNQ
jgi:hypothetical protein